MKERLEHHIKSKPIEFDWFSPFEPWKTVNFGVFSYLLAAGELELGPPESLDDGILVLVVGSDRHERLSDANASDETLGFAKGTPHSSLKPIGSGTRQHLVDPQNMERMDSNPDVELILGRVLHHVLKENRFQSSHRITGFDFG